MTAPTDKGPAIELIGLTKRFGRTLAVDRLSLTIPRGSVFGLLGPNGAGKSTTIKMLMGMLAPTDGQARVLGIDVAADPVEVKQRVGYVPETHQHLSLDARRRSARFLQVVFPLVERSDLPGDGRVVRLGLGEKGQASLEGDAGEAGAFVGGRP